MYSHVHIPLQEYVLFASFGNKKITVVCLLTIYCHVSYTGLYNASGTRRQARVSTLIILRCHFNNVITDVFPVRDKATVLHPAVLRNCVTFG